MKCSIPLNSFETRMSKGIAVPIIGKDEFGKRKRDLPEYLQIGEAWKVFGKWMVAMGESDQEQIKIRDGMHSGHVCIVLRGIGFTLYFYELIGDYTKEQLKIFNYIRLVLDRVLVTNQVASVRLRFYLEKFYKWNGNIFPKFFNTFDNKKISEWSDQIDEEIDRWSKVRYHFKNKNNNNNIDEYWRSITKPNKKEKLWDIKGCYAELLSIFNTIKSDLPQDNIIVIDELIVRCEHGYFLGFLVEKSFKEYNEAHPNVADSHSAIRSKNYLLDRVRKFRTGREKRVAIAAKEAFGLTPEVVKKLNRMFVYKKVKI
jgi:hypothetical protein